MLTHKRSLRDYVNAKALRTAPKPRKAPSPHRWPQKPYGGLQRGGKGLRRTPLKRVSAKRAEQLREYSIRRKAFLEAHPFCAVAAEASKKMFVNRQVGTFWMEHTPATDIHHIRGRRDAMLLDERYWLAVSREGHDAIHQNPNKAREMGWLV